MCPRHKKRTTKRASFKGGSFLHIRAHDFVSLCYTCNMYDNEEKQEKNIALLRQEEEEHLLQKLATEKYHLPFIDLNKVMVENESLHIVSEADARMYEVAPFAIKGKEVKLAVRAPERADVIGIRKALEKKGFIVYLFIATLASMQKVWGRYKEVENIEKVKAGGFDIASSAVLETAKEVHTLDDVKALIDTAMAESRSRKISRLLEIIFSGAIALGVSDVHIEPQESDARIRFRLDGVLHDVYFFDTETYWFLNSRLKILSGLKLIRDKAQDGRFSIFVEGGEINIRTSIIPGAYGESVVMRILNPKSIHVELEAMGIEPKLFSIIERELSKPNGLILITGPTGSGKTTTLYAFLQRMYSEEIKIITIEDPVEYHLPGITQTQTNGEEYGFAEGLRSALRQDPDVIMVGEIRDPDTARIAVESSLTGHLVFSTLHTNNAGGVIPRLIDLEVNAKILSSALSLSIAQRLVRTLCKDCKVSRAVTPEEDTLIRTILSRAIKNGKDVVSYGVSLDQPLLLYTAPGCQSCNGIGYKGRIGIFEAIVCDTEIQKLLPTNPSEREIVALAQKQGILIMQEDGIIKALKGATSLEEVKTVVDVYEGL